MFDIAMGVPEMKELWDDLKKRVKDPSLNTHEITELSKRCSAIYHHDDKHVTDSEMDEVLKDADVIHHCMNDLSKPIKEKEQSRYEKIRLGLL